ncbi:hypothetical protein Bbelb_110930 [Branchiostoma belcheri]|nr:hypothetical protein Bbelb_110930 [Branchiostoma belcheri]
MDQGHQESESATFRIKDTPLKNVSTFTYLGSVLNASGDISDEVQRRIGLTSASFGRLANRVFLNKDLTTKTKVAVYRAICLSILPYACETWTTYRRHIRTLKQFHTRCVQRILGLKWWHKVPHGEIRRRAHMEPLETLLVQRQLRWAGHVIRMQGNRLLRHILFGELTNGSPSVGVQHKRYKDNLKTNFKKCGMQPHRLEETAAERNRWRHECATGITIYTSDYNRLAKSFYFCGRGSEERRESGVGLTVKVTLVDKLAELQKGVNDRLMTMKPPLLSGKKHVTVVSAYAPTMINTDVVKDEFYENFHTVITAVPKTDKLVILGDFNARVGTDSTSWEGVTGKHGIVLGRKIDKMSGLPSLCVVLIAGLTIV